MPKPQPRGVDLKRLQQEAERLVKLLQVGEVGLASWNIMLREQLKILKELIQEAGL